jgi:hypothetical protein
MKSIDCSCTSSKIQACVTEGPLTLLQVDGDRVPMLTNLLVPESESELYHYQARNLAFGLLSPRSLQSVKCRRFSDTNVLCEAVANAVKTAGMAITALELVERLFYMMEDEGVLSLPLAHSNGVILLRMLSRRSKSIWRPWKFELDIKDRAASPLV